MSSKNIELAIECKRLSENCLYTSTSLFIWLKFLRTLKVFFTVTPLLLGSFASWDLLRSSDLSEIKTLTAIFPFLAGLLPSVYSALKFDDNLSDTIHLASEFKNLQGRFRQAALVSSKKPFDEFEQEFKLLSDRLERAQTFSITPPEWCFKRARLKIKAGDYDFDIELQDS